MRPEVSCIRCSLLTGGDGRWVQRPKAREQNSGRCIHCVERKLTGSEPRVPEVQLTRHGKMEDVLYIVEVNPASMEMSTVVTLSSCH
jgi:hypothetical protein